jgi:hypothetical protein
MKQTVITWRDLSELPDEGEGILSVRKHFDKEEWGFIMIVFMEMCGETM